EMIFEPFFQGSHQRKGAVKGSGLGLSIARDCIRRMQMRGNTDLRIRRGIPYLNTDNVRINIF
ncbi:hypothetical protein MJM25_21100, partial [Salmonella enterica subsp. enterica serovar Lubbock]|nr:hypothetical protein [Salmonella enterica subsp. enterica serovar Lubbock]